MGGWTLHVWLPLRMPEPTASRRNAKGLIVVGLSFRNANHSPVIVAKPIRIG